MFKRKESTLNSIVRYFRSSDGAAHNEVCPVDQYFVAFGASVQGTARNTKTFRSILYRLDKNSDAKNEKTSEERKKPYTFRTPSCGFYYKNSEPAILEVTGYTTEAEANTGNTCTRREATWSAACDRARSPYEMQSMWFADSTVAVQNVAVTKLSTGALDTRCAAGVTETHFGMQTQQNTVRWMPTFTQTDGKQTSGRNNLGRMTNWQTLDCGRENISIKDVLLAPVYLLTAFNQQPECRGIIGELLYRQACAREMRLRRSFERPVITGLRCTLHASSPNDIAKFADQPPALTPDPRINEVFCFSIPTCGVDIGVDTETMEDFELAVLHGKLRSVAYSVCSQFSRTARERSGDIRHIVAPPWQRWVDSTNERDRSQTKVKVTAQQTIDFFALADEIFDKFYTFFVLREIDGYHLGGDDFRTRREARTDLAVPPTETPGPHGLPSWARFCAPQLFEYGHSLAAVLSKIRTLVAVSQIGGESRLVDSFQKIPDVIQKPALSTEYAVTSSFIYKFISFVSQYNDTGKLSPLEVADALAVTPAEVVSNPATAIFKVYISIDRHNSHCHYAKPPDITFKTAQITFKENERPHEREKRLQLAQQNRFVLLQKECKYWETAWNKVLVGNVAELLMGDPEQGKRLELKVSIADYLDPYQHSAEFAKKQRCWFATDEFKQAAELSQMLCDSTEVSMSVTADMLELGQFETKHSKVKKAGLREVREKMDFYHKELREKRIGVQIYNDGAEQVQAKNAPLNLFTAKPHGGGDILDAEHDLFSTENNHVSFFNATGIYALAVSKYANTIADTEIAKKMVVKLRPPEFFKRHQQTRGSDEQKKTLATLLRELHEGNQSKKLLKFLDHVFAADRKMVATLNDAVAFFLPHDTALQQAFEKYPFLQTDRALGVSILKYLLLKPGFTEGEEAFDTMLDEEGTDTPLKMRVQQNDQTYVLQSKINGEMVFKNEDLLICLTDELILPESLWERLKAEYPAKTRTWSQWLRGNQRSLQSADLGDDRASVQQQQYLFFEEAYLTSDGKKILTKPQENYNRDAVMTALLTRTAKNDVGEVLEKFAQIPKKAVKVLSNDVVKRAEEYLGSLRHFHHAGLQWHRMLAYLFGLMLMQHESALSDPSAASTFSTAYDVLKKKMEKHTVGAKLDAGKAEDYASITSELRNFLLEHSRCMAGIPFVTQQVPGIPATLDSRVNNLLYTMFFIDNNLRLRNDSQTPVTIKSSLVQFKNIFDAEVITDACRTISTVDNSFPADKSTQVFPIEYLFYGLVFGFIGTLEKPGDPPNLHVARATFCAHVFRLYLQDFFWADKKEKKLNFETVVAACAVGKKLSELHACDLDERQYQSFQTVLLPSHVNIPAGSLEKLDSLHADIAVIYKKLLPSDAIEVASVEIEIAAKKLTINTAGARDGDLSFNLGEPGLCKLRMYICPGGVVLPSNFFTMSAAQRKVHLTSKNLQRQALRSHVADYYAKHVLTGFSSAPGDCGFGIHWNGKCNLQKQHSAYEYSLSPEGIFWTRAAVTGMFEITKRGERNYDEFFTVPGFAEPSNAGEASWFDVYRNARFCSKDGSSPVIDNPKPFLLSPECLRTNLQSHRFKDNSAAKLHYWAFVGFPQTARGATLENLFARASHVYCSMPPTDKIEITIKTMRLETDQKLAFYYYFHGCMKRVATAPADRPFAESGLGDHPFANIADEVYLDIFDYFCKLIGFKPLHAKKTRDKEAIAEEHTAFFEIMKYVALRTQTMRVGFAQLSEEAKDHKESMIRVRSLLYMIHSQEFKSNVLESGLPFEEKTAEAELTSPLLNRTSKIDLLLEVPCATVWFTEHRLGGMLRLAFADAGERETFYSSLCITEWVAYMLDDNATHFEEAEEAKFKTSTKPLFDRIENYLTPADQHRVAVAVANVLSPATKQAEAVTAASNLLRSFELPPSHHLSSEITKKSLCWVERETPSTVETFPNIRANRHAHFCKTKGGSFFYNLQSNDFTKQCAVRDVISAARAICKTYNHLSPTGVFRSKSVVKLTLRSQRQSVQLPSYSTQLADPQLLVKRALEHVQECLWYYDVQLSKLGSNENLGSISQVFKPQTSLRGADAAGLKFEIDQPAETDSEPLPAIKIEVNNRGEPGRAERKGTDFRHTATQVLLRTFCCCAAKILQAINQKIYGHDYTPANETAIEDSSDNNDHFPMIAPYAAELHYMMLAMHRNSASNFKAYTPHNLLSIEAILHSMIHAADVWSVPATVDATSPDDSFVNWIRMMEYRNSEARSTVYEVTQLRP